MSTEQILRTDVNQQRKMIDEDFCFHCHYPSIARTQQAYAYYVDHKKQQKELYNSSIPIAIDTCVLLELYSISFSERTQFLRFINENAHRIIITSQVQNEYMSHRIDAIQSFIRTLKDVEDFPKKIQDTLKQTFDTVLSQLKSNGNRPIVLKDMVDVPEHIETVRKFIEQNKFKDEFVKEIEETFRPLIESVKIGVDHSLEKAVYELTDPVLAALSKTTILSDLLDEERKFLKGRYDELLCEFNKNKDSVQKKELFAFPGCGDRKKSKDGRDPYGDFFIYHELLSYMWQYNKDVVFLTNDVTKSDWIKSDGKPFNHYIVDTFVNTGHMIYILNARDFTTLSFEAVADVDSSENDDDLTDFEETSLVSSKLNAIPCNDVDSEPSPANSVHVGENKDEDILPKNESQPASVHSENIRYSYLRDVTKERFLQELEIAELWAKNYGDGYVSQDHFIYSILGHKRFDYRSSFLVLNMLLQDKLVIVEEEQHDGRAIKCLKKVR